MVGAGFNTFAHRRDSASATASCATNSCAGHFAAGDLGLRR